MPSPLKPISLVVDARMIRHSGIGTYLRNLLPHFLEDPGYAVTLLGDADKWEHPRAKWIACGARIYSIGEQLSLLWTIPRCDIFWSPHFNVPLLPVRAKRRLVTLHDTYHLAHPETMGKVAHGYARLLYCKAVSASKLVLTVSESSRRQIIEHLPAAQGKISVIPNGIDPDYAKHKPSANAHGDYLLFVGNIKPHKNLARLLIAYRTVLESFPSLRLVVVGKESGFLSPDTQFQQALAGLPEGKVVFRGEASNDELKSLYAQAKLFVMPSTYEGFGLPILEAMALGTPIVVSDIPPFREVGGDAVLYFNPLDPVSMATGILEALRMPARDPASLYAPVLASFSWVRSAKSHREAVAQLARGE